MKTLLQQEIEKTRNYLWRFAQTYAWDSGVRDVQAEYYLKGLERAQRLVNKQKKIDLSEKEKKE